MRKRIFTVILAFVSAFAVMGCAVPEGGGGDEYLEQVDSSRVQLYVYNYNGGYGTDWLMSLKAKYEELHKNDKHGDKTGVQIMVSNPKQGVTQGDVKANKTNDVYFVEGIYYDQFRTAGVIADITDAVTGENPYETSKTIESKFTDSQKEFYGVDINDGGGKHYYAIPHYSGYYGIVYNVDLFEDRGYYFAETPSGTNLWDKFITPQSDEARSKGPDGKSGTFDDGLPATYEEFYDLCDYIAGVQDTPFVWTGQYYVQHLMNLYNNLVANYEGVEDMMKNYTFSGTANDLGTIVNGAFVKDSAPTTLSASHGYETKRQAGKYYALEFLEKLIKTETWQEKDSFKITFSHMDAQSRFVRSVPDSSLSDIAMIVDGNWWQAEAKSAFESAAASYGEKYSAAKANYAWMPLPKANADKVGEKQVLVDHLNGLSFVNANSTRKELAKDFLQYVNSDESLWEFTKITNTVKALDYTLSEEQISKLNPYGQSLVRFKQSKNTEIVYPIARNSTFVNNQSMFNDHRYAYASSSTNNDTFATLIHEDGSTAAELFKNYYTYFKDSWSTLVGSN